MKILTLQAANELKGKKIRATYSGYAGQDGDTAFIVGDIISHWEFAKNNIDFNGYKNQQEYWLSYMSDVQIAKYKDKKMLLNDKGNPTFCVANKWSFVDKIYNEDNDVVEEPNDYCFWASDEDRFVSFELAS